jgi:glutaredoxin-like YruB-family protein
MNPSIVVFGTSTCSWCRKAKEYLRSRGYAFKYVDVSADASALQDMTRKSGQQSVPQFWINNVAVVGFDRDKIETLISKYKKK